MADYEEIELDPSGSTDRRVLVGFLVGMGLIGTVGWLGVTLPAADDPVDGEASPAEDPSPEVAATGHWRLDPAADRPTLVLEASNEVADRLNRRGRPSIRIVCGSDGAVVTVSPGVPSVAAVSDEVTYALYADVAVTREDQASQHLRADLSPDDRDLHLPTDVMLEAMSDSETLFVSYAPFASKNVMAIFDVRGLEQATGQLGSCAL